MVSARKILELNKDRILNNNYPASIGARILLIENDYNYYYGKKIFRNWISNKGFIANMDNF